MKINLLTFPANRVVRHCDHGKTVDCAECLLLEIREHVRRDQWRYEALAEACLMAAALGAAVVLALWVRR